MFRVVSNSIPIRFDLALKEEVNVMSVYKSAASIFRERLFDNKDGLIWMWNLPELNQSNLHVWFLSLFVFAFFFHS